jgi:hypothetical protein
MGLHKGVGGGLVIELGGGKDGLGYGLTPYGETLTQGVGNVKYNIAD